MDGVNDLLQATRLAGGVFLDAEFTAPWCVHSGVTAEECAPFVANPTHIIAYHYICEGRMTLAESQALRRFYEWELNGYTYLE